ncbi:MAG: Dihydroorotate dehydrogenase (quinone) [Alphaproteobacteria bacterium MarineAlpha5_Bin11]|nr:dihydroorotate dehydrogenase (quinone) [Pelagibacteraceae bacterium]PPR43353.1 MAG: Dihydroorotate dehydrogenase (quinone) [Alphaproteobacteria bacterium MarineAlpha5_Bin11]PPR52031.1 MAG: Dihydroorotate dehydrogenase (quinone) [Alphaproteobacteria bacterium MarineAlpha5_Bin10]|tara:strand:+ start:3590 stop:4651 length:1062 start_codon:yes stop_codon:yes gene_type:complete
MIRIILAFLRFLPPEFSHFLTLLSLKSGMFKNVSRIRNNQVLHQVIWNIEFENPLGLAAGFDKNAEVINETLDLGFGFVEVGTVTPKPQYGNAKPRVFRLNQDKAIINHLGFNNLGMQSMKKKLIKRSQNPYLPFGILGINIGKNYDTKKDFEDYIECINNLGPYADYLVINISSPNTPKLRELQHRENLEELINIVKKNNDLNKISKPILIKIAPDLNDQQKRDIALTSLAQGIDGIIISNTSISRPKTLFSKHKDEIGGLSGKPIFLPSTNLLKEMFIYTGGRIPLIGVGGITTGKDAYEKIKSGASLIQIYTGLVFEGPKAINKINSELIYLLQADGYGNISEAVGADVQ